LPHTTSAGSEISGFPLQPKRHVLRVYPI
jgi:hypothetical protein